MWGDTPPRMDLDRFLELQEKEDMGTITEDERQELQTIIEKNNPYDRKHKDEVIRSKRSFEKLLQEHIDKLDEYKRDPDKGDHKRCIARCIS